MKTGLQCKRQYWFRYIKGWKIQGKNLALALGTAFHAGVEKMNTLDALDKKIEIDDIYEEFDTAFTNETQNYEEGVDFRNEYDINSAYQMGIELLEKYWNSSGRKLMKPILYRPEGSGELVPAVEMKINIPLLNLETGESINDDWILIGYIDVIKKVVKDSKRQKINKGNICILDYKTTSREYDEFKLHTLIQLLLYSYAIRYILNYDKNVLDISKDKEDYVGIIEILKRKKGENQSAKTRLISISDGQINELQKFIHDFILYISDGNWIPNFTDQCSYCDYKEPCFKMTMGIDPEEWWTTKGSKNAAVNNRR